MYTSEHQEKKDLIGYTDIQTCNTIQKLYRCEVGIAHLHDHSHRTNSDIIRKELYITRIVYSSKYHNASNEFGTKSRISSSSPCQIYAIYFPVTHYKIYSN